MRKNIRILETPIYLLVIAMACYEMAAGGIAIFLAIVSAARLYTNIITYDSVYKKQLITNLMYLAADSVMSYIEDYLYTYFAKYAK